MIGKSLVAYFLSPLLSYNMQQKFCSLQGASSLVKNNFTENVWFEQSTKDEEKAKRLLLHVERELVTAKLACNGATKEEHWLWH